MAQGTTDRGADREILPLPLPVIDSPRDVREDRSPPPGRTERLRFDDFAAPPEEDDGSRQGIPEEEVAALLEKAREEAYEKGISEGYGKGHADAMEALEADMHRMHLAISGSLDNLDDHRERLAGLLEDSAARFMERLASLLAPRLPEEFFPLHLEEMVRHIARSAITDQEIVFCLPPAQIDAHGERVRQLLVRENRSLRVSLESDASLSPGQAKALWTNGEMELNLHEFSDRIVKNILNVGKEN